MKPFIASLVIVLLGLTGCSNLQGTDGKDYVGGDGQVVQVPQDERGDPVEVSGDTLDGKRFDVADSRGNVVVVNVWGAWCPECRAEQPLLVETVDELPADTVVLGIDIRDPSPDNARAFVRTFEVPYPSIYDPGSEQLLAFPDPVNPRSTPSTVVLDRQGRVAAVIAGRLPSKLTLLDLVDSVAAEDG